MDKNIRKLRYHINSSKIRASHDYIEIIKNFEAHLNISILQSKSLKGMRIVQIKIWKSFKYDYKKTKRRTTKFFISAFEK